MTARSGHHGELGAGALGEDTTSSVTLKRTILARWCGLASGIREVVMRGMEGAGNGGPSAGPGRCGTDNPGTDRDDGSVPEGKTQDSTQGRRFPSFPNLPLNALDPG